MALYDLQTLTINIVMIILYTIVCAKITMIYFSTFIFFTLIFHLYYFLFPRQIGYGDILLLSILSCFPYHFYLIFLLYTLLIAIIVSSILLIMKRNLYSICTIHVYWFYNDKLFIPEHAIIHLERLI